MAATFVQCCDRPCLRGLANFDCLDVYGFGNVRVEIQVVNSKIKPRLPLPVGIFRKAGRSDQVLYADEGEVLRL